MSQVTASLVKELRDRTGLGMMECKRALVESGADIDKAIDELRKSSGMKAAKKAGRTAADGIVLVKADAGFGMVLEVNSETDFAARDEGFKGFANSVLDAEIAAKMVEGRVSKFLKEGSLIDQPFVKDPDTTIGKLVAASDAEVISFVRFEVGEGIEVEEVDFAAEVAAQVAGVSE